MTLTLEQVRNTRFHLARRSGYEPVDVDEFVDKVEATLAALFSENDSLKQQLADAASAPGFAAPVAAGEADPAAMSAANAEIAKLQDQLARQSDDINRLRADITSRDQELVPLRAEVQKLREAAVSSQQAPTGERGVVENIVVSTSEEAAPAVSRLLQMATEQAERLVGESQMEAQRLVTQARTEAESVLDTANRKAHEIITDSRTRAERTESEARVNAQQLTSDAQSKADAVNAEAEARRNELFTKLESERDILKAKVDDLRNFEKTFRTNLTGHLQSQIKSLESTVLEPPQAPELLKGGPDSSTPRLDALLNEQS
ncbi:MAG: DivIVA domain-containing protein [Propionibacteriaceae bacterium]|jgi:DivIVA domain-containing protein|nr:DivIVA domain-containing protein [Propionibacteriaceae bacterium]